VLTRKISFLYYYLPSATVAGLALVHVLTRGNSPRWLLWGFVAMAAAGFAAMVPISVAPVETSMATYLRLMLFKTWI
jgi:dolichyl-phosphate-mannose-protein mannosyltransferase